MNILDIIRGCVRPYLAFIFPTVIVVLAVILVLKFADADMAMLIVVFILATGSVIVGFYFGERSQKAKEEPKPNKE